MSNRPQQKPLPTSLQSDFIPSEIMDALAPRHTARTDLGPPERYRRLPGRAASVWNFPQRRDRLKHLTHNAACVCGAGKNLSFLYDAMTEAEVPTEATTLRKSTQLALAKKGVTVAQEAASEMKLPDTLVPSEFHIVKNKGVSNLEIRDEPFTTLPLTHDKHPVGFPSMQPSSKRELKELRKGVDSVLEQLGARGTLQLRGPTQMHRLLELVKKEQDVYNVLFFEVIRQATVECAERGELLAVLRRNYQGVLERAPVQVKGLHDEVMAQRALDRRLTEELVRFKRAIGGLTAELTDVKRHDQQSFSEAQFSREELKKALEKAQRSSNLLEEYHSLYELQRQRLNEQVARFSEERLLWRRAAYELALRVTEQSRLATVSSLHRSETEWHRLANVFTAMLTERDKESIVAMKKNVGQWRSKAEEVALLLSKRDQQTTSVIVEVRDKIEAMRYAFVESYFSKDGHMIKAPDQAKGAEILRAIINWEESLSTEIENFGGDSMLTMQDNMTFMKSLVAKWTDSGLALFMRHKQEENGENYPEHGTMLHINKEIDVLMQQFLVRLTGENGVARALITLNNVLETWHSRIDSTLHSNKPLPEAEWSRFYVQLEDWIGMLDEAEQCVGRTQREEDFQANRIHRHLETSQVIVDVNKWMDSSENGIDSEDLRLLEQISSMHTSMIKWMVQILLRLAPDHPGNSREAHEAALFASAAPEDLKETAVVLSGQLSVFTKYLAQCCQLIVSEIMQTKLDNHQEDADYEFNLLKELQAQADLWVSVSENLLTEERTGQVVIETEEVKEEEKEEEEEEQVKDIDQIRRESLATLDAQPSLVLPKTPDFASIASRGASPSGGSAAPGPRLQAIGVDRNTHERELLQSADSPQEDVVQLEEGLQPSRLDTTKAFATMRSVEELQQAVSNQEEAAQEVEERAMSVQLELAEVQERRESLEARLQLLATELKALKPPEEEKTEIGPVKEEAEEEEGGEEKEKGEIGPVKEEVEEEEGGEEKKKGESA